MSNLLQQAKDTAHELREVTPQACLSLPGTVSKEAQLAADLIQAQAARIERLEAALISTAASLAASISLLRRAAKSAAPSDKMFDQMLVDYEASLGEARAVLKGNKE